MYRSAQAHSAQHTTTTTTTATTAITTTTTATTTATVTTTTPPPGHTHIFQYLDLAHDALDVLVVLALELVEHGIAVLAPVAVVSGAVSSARQAGG